jgi:ACS family sodium-dependent inorganic phosphate cotransporter
MVDIAPNHAGFIMGISNSFATLPGVFGNILTGFILDRTGSYTFVWLSTIVVYSIGCLAFHRWSKGNEVLYK